MFDEKVVYPTQFPVEERNRKTTDVCCTIIGAIFALTMFIVACTMWNKGNTHFIQIALIKLSSDSTAMAKEPNVNKDNLFIQAIPTILKY